MIMYITIANATTNARASNLLSGGGFIYKINKVVLVGLME